MDTAVLRKVILQLEDSLKYYYSDPVQQDAGLVLQMRTAAIKAFSLTYELSLKMIKWYFKQVFLNPADLADLSFVDLI